MILKINTNRHFYISCRKRECTQSRYKSYSYCKSHHELYSIKCTVAICARYARDRETKKCIQHGGKRFQRKKCLCCTIKDAKRIGYCRPCYRKNIICSEKGCLCSASVDSKDKCAFHKIEKKIPILEFSQNVIGS